MKRTWTLVLAWAAFSASAAAQSSAATGSTPGHGYVEAVAQSAFGNVTSQSFGGEAGVNVWPGIAIFVDAGVVRDAAPASLGASAQAIATGIAAVAGNAGYRVKAPATFGVVGIRYVIPVASNRVEPYVLAGGGAARVKREVSFSTTAGDVSQFATVGTDLSGSETKGMLSIGVGAAVPVWRAMVIDLQYRYGRVFASDEALNLNRAGIGVGVRF